VEFLVLELELADFQTVLFSSKVAACLEAMATFTCFSPISGLSEYRVVEEDPSN
jgi:hypothetical protein